MILSSSVSRSMIVSSTLSNVYAFQCRPTHFLFFFYSDTAATEIYTLSLHDALPILDQLRVNGSVSPEDLAMPPHTAFQLRSEEHTSELQSRGHLVCRLLLEKKKAFERYIREAAMHRIREFSTALDTEHRSDGESLAA